VPISEDLAADTQYHRPVPRHERSECSLAGCATPRVESLQELPVGEPGHGAAVEERLDLLGNGPLCQMAHTRQLPGIRNPCTRRHLIPTEDTVMPAVIVSQVVLDTVR
jgi:hypothetical protein